jgi:hypothetical protein
MKINFVEDIFKDSYVDERKMIQHPLPPGSAKFAVDKDGKMAALNFICPCGCKLFYSLPLNQPSGCTWQWDGNREEPTVTPSIKNGNCGYHGFLTKGEWSFCSDSGTKS